MITEEINQLIKYACSTRQCICCGKLTEGCCSYYEEHACTCRLHMFCGTHSDLWLSDSKVSLINFLDQNTMLATLSFIDGDF